MAVPQVSHNLEGSSTGSLLALLLNPNLGATGTPGNSGGCPQRCCWMPLAHVLMS